MKILFLGGSGVISRAVAQRTITDGHELWLLNRGQRRPVEGARHLRADASDADGIRSALSGHRWDVVVDWIAYAPSDIRRDLELFRTSARQYIFISSASVYQKPLEHYLVTEETPLSNPYWEYSRLKIACETELRAACEKGFPGVIVRPSHTYGEDYVPLVLNPSKRSWTAIDRLRRGAPVIIPGDGNSLWTLTHNTDFAEGLAGLFGNPTTLGQAFHITSDEVLTWNQIFRQTAEAAGVLRPDFVHISTDFIAACLPAAEGTLRGDKAVSIVFDNSKIRRFVPRFRARVPFAEGIRRTIAWFEADSARQTVDAGTNERWDKLFGAYQSAAIQGRRPFGAG